MGNIVIKKDSFGLIQVLSFTGSQYFAVKNQLLYLANHSKSCGLQNRNERIMSEIERNGTSYRTCLKCKQYKYLGSIPGIVYRFFSEKIYFLHQIILYTLNYYFIHVHSSEYCITVLHRHVFLAFLTGGTMNL